MDELVSVFDERDGSNAEEIRGALGALTADYETRGLELLREGLIEIVQSEAYGPLHVRLGNPARHLKLVADDDAANDTQVKTQ